jgi:hypothetical protein
MTMRPRSSRRGAGRSFETKQPARESGGDGRRGEQISDYIASIAAELQQLALANRMPILAYLLDMARLEAETTARGLRLHNDAEEEPGD